MNCQPTRLLTNVIDAYMYKANIYIYYIHISLWPMGLHTYTYTFTYTYIDIYIYVWRHIYIYIERHRSRERSHSHVCNYERISLAYALIRAPVGIRLEHSFINSTSSSNHMLRSRSSYIHLYMYHGTSRHTWISCFCHPPHTSRKLPEIW